MEKPNETSVPEIQQTVVTFHVMTPEEEAKEIERLKEKWAFDEASALGNAERRGFKEGYEIGLKEGREMIEKMRKSGISEEQIQKIVIDEPSEIRTTSEGETL